MKQNENKETREKQKKGLIFDKLNKVFDKLISPFATRIDKNEELLNRLTSENQDLHKQVWEYEQKLVGLTLQIDNITTSYQQKHEDLISKIQVLNSKADSNSSLLQNLNALEENVRNNNERLDSLDNTLSIRLDSLDNTLSIVNAVAENVRNNNNRIEAIDSGLAIVNVIAENVRNNNDKLEIMDNKLSAIEQIEESLRRDEENLRNNNDRLEILSTIELNLKNLNGVYEKLRPMTEFSLFNKITNSQAGEDSIMAYIFAVIGLPFDKCTYVDLGANHPREMSNTYFFYSQGARGVLLDANEAMCDELRRERPGDIVLNRCVDSVSGNIVTFNITNFEGLSTTEDIADLEKENPNVRIERSINIETISYNDIIERFLGKGPQILNLDIEGKEMDILESIDFEKYRPFVIIIEMIPYSTKLVVNKKNKAILDFMVARGYDEFAFTGINSIFIDKVKLQTIYNERDNNGKNSTD